MGSGFKNFTAGDVLTEADLDGYLMRQTVMTFTNTAARDSALSGVLDEGMVAYAEDVNAFYFYTGSAWEPLLTSWTSFTPAWTNLTVGNGTNAGVYKYTNGALDIKVAFTFGSTSAITGQPSFLLPNSETSVSDGIRNLGLAWYLDNTGTDTWGPVGCNAGSSSVFLYVETLTGVSSTAPFTWATDDSIDLNISVRV